MSHQIYSSDERINVCKLEDGSERIYHLATSADKDPMKAYDVRHYDYIGTGTIQSINNVPYSGNDKCHFYLSKGR